MRISKIICFGLLLLGSGVAVLNVPISNNVQRSAAAGGAPVRRLDLSAFSVQPPEKPLDLLFIHHSCGGQLLASSGPAVGQNCVFTTHPNGGDLRALLEQNRYQVHQASYGSRIGQNTDIFDWVPRFRDQMDEILLCDLQDRAYMGAQRNQIVMFKSCFPNNAFRGEGTAPGDSAGPELTVWNARAAYSALLPEFQKQPNVLFVCLTAPPQAPGKASQPLWRKLAREAKATIKGNRFDIAESGRLARQFNSWLADTNGWLKEYPLRNVVVFDYYDVLTDHGQSDLSRYSTWGGADSHPSHEGNEKAARALVPFLNQAVHRAGLSTSRGSSLSSR
jgi:hypothetical protein